MRAFVFGLLAVGLVAACGSPAGPDKAALPAFEVETHAGDFAEIQQFTTPGGVSVWLVQEPSIPIVALQASWAGGVAADPEGREGLAGAVAYQMNEGAGDLDALAFQTRMEELNMSFGCSADRDWMNCSASMLSENAAAAMDLVALAFSEPRFDEGPFERAKRESLIGLKQRETNPSFLAGDAMENALYPDHAYARNVTEDSVNAITREEARAYQKTLMTRDRLRVTAVGNVSAHELAGLVDKAFANLPASGDVNVPGPLSLAEPAAEPIVVTLPQPQTLVSFAAPGMQRNHPDFFAAFVLNYTLGGGGFASRLMEELREKRGLTYGIGTRLDFGGELALWAGGGQTKNESAGEFLEVLKGELQKFVDDGITAEELSDAKAYLTGSYALGFDSNSKIAANMMQVRQQDLGVDYFDRRNAMVEAVSLDDVNRVARTYLLPDRFTFVLVGEPEGLSDTVD